MSLSIPVKAAQLQAIEGVRITFVASLIWLCIFKVFLPKAPHDFRDVCLNSAPTVARAEITKGLNLKITVKNSF